MRPPSEQQPPDRQLDADRRRNGEQGPRPALEEAEGHLADDEDDRHEDRGEIPVIEARPQRCARDGSSRASRSSRSSRASRPSRSSLCHAGSSIRWMRFTAGRVSS